MRPPDGYIQADQERKTSAMKAIRTKIDHIPLLTVAKGGAFESGIVAARAEHGHCHTKHLLQERVIYSLLAYRSRKGLGASVREICRTTGLHHKTVRITLNNLSDFIHEHGGKWFANQPPQDWFRTVPDHTVTHWSEQYAYVWLLLPRHGAKFQVGQRDRRFSLSHAVVYSYLRSLADEHGIVRGFTVAGLSKLLNDINPKTIKSILGDLASLELLVQKQKSVKLLPFKERHLSLFAPPKKLAADIKEEPKSALRPKSNEYEMKNDGFDEHRRLCQTFMAQSYSERVIRAVRFLGWSLTDFHLHLEDRKKDSEDNVKSGKCRVENFGKFYTKPLEERVAAIEKDRRLAEAEQRRIDFLSSPEGKEAEAERKAAICADPLHPLHTVDHESILSRVRFAPEPSKNWREAERLKSKVHSHCRSYVGALGLGTQQSVDKTGDLVCMIQKNALAKLNGYYQQEELAVPEQFQEAIDEAIRKVEPRMPLLFAEEAAVTCDS